MSIPPVPHPHAKALRPITRTATAVVVALALVTGNHQPGLTAAASMKADPDIELRKDESVPGVDATPQAGPADPTRERVVGGAPEVRWPAPGAADVTVPAPGGSTERSRAGELPVWVAPTRERATTGKVPSKVRVEITGQRDDALLLSVHRTDGVTQTGRIVLGVDYAAFRDAYGGDWANRLRLVIEPACAATTPTAAGCQSSVLPTYNNGSGQLTAEVPVSAKPTTLAVTAGASSGAGDYNNGALSDGGATWSVGGSSGDFEWSLPFDVPPGMGGPQPAVSLQYSSGAVDGLSSTTNNQTSIVGQGFELGGGGAIERRYKSCGKDRTGGNNANRTTGDLCFAGDSMTISLNGASGSLVLASRDADGNEVWRMRGDDGSIVERLHGMDNGDGGIHAADRGEYWRVTSTDGTRYFFGRNKLPGWTAGAATTNSAWTAPVFGNHADEQCHQPGSFATSWCQQAYRWNLDYVVDRHGNTQSLYYDTETGRYARNLTATAVSPYVRAGNLKRIEYGQRDGQAFTQRAVGQVLFTTAERCTPQPCAPDRPATYPDAPWDLNCASTTNCSNHFTPTFWTQKRLARITTQVWRAGPARYEDVKSWTLRQDYLRADNTGAALWLAGVTNAGHVGAAQQMPEIRFSGVAKDNRVDTGSDMVPPLQWFRVSAVHYGTGGDLAVTYSGTDCTPTGLPQPDTNNRRCRPQKWTPENQPEREDWYHKYVVTKVVQTDRTAASNAPSAPVPVTTTIEYPDPPAWRFDELDATTSVADSTWSQWRGYSKVRVIKGTPGETRSVNETLYFRGMDGDRTGAGGVKDVKITDSTGLTVDDVNEFSGQAREQQTYRDGAVIDKNISDYWLSAPTATMTRPWGTLEAHKSGHKELVQYQAVDGGTLRTSSKHTYTADGRLAAKHELNDVANPADDTCTNYEYVSNPTAGLRDLPVRQQTLSVGCGQPWTKDHVVVDERIYYDNATSYTAPPQRGLVTKGERLSGFDASGQPTYQAVFTATYDAIGRQTMLTNALQQSTERIFTPAYGPVTSVTDVAANEHRTTTEYEPAWAEPVAITEPDGRRAEVVHDALGRSSKAWKPGHSRASDPPDVEYEYAVSGTAASVVTTKTRIDSDSVDVSHELYDGLMRLRQTQESTPAGGRLVTDHRFDSRGHQTEVNGAYYNDAPPSTELLLVDPAALPKQEITVWDAGDRPTAQILKREGGELARTTHSVNATRQSIDPPDGQAPTTRITDARGRLVELRQYTGNAPTGPYDSTRYSYDPAGRLKMLTDPAGNVWRYNYDIRGRQISEHDPDKGLSTFEYDDADQVVAATDARGVRLAHAYDEIGRRTALHRTSLSTPPLVQWTYDTLAAGRPTSSTRYVTEGSTRSAYTTAVTGYDAAGRPTGQSVTLPAAEGRLAGTYTVGQTYTNDDEVATRTLPAAGDLPGETLTYEYNEQGLPTGLHSGLGSYVRDQTYTPYDEAETLTLGQDTGRWVQQLFEYELGTRRVNRVVTNREMLPRRISDTSYEYDLAGNVTKVTDVPSATSGEPTDTQCFDYDHLRRLTQAWTPSDEGCEATPVAASLGGPAPYWHKWTFDKTGNRKTEQRISAAGTITSTYDYGPAGSANPHALRGVTTTGPAGTTTKSFGYDQIGNTTTRTDRGVTETLAWDAEGRLTGATKAGQSTAFLYDGDGSRLIRRDTSGTTVYLGETELTLSPNGTVTGTRHYAFDERVVAVRTEGRLSWLLTDLQGNPTTAIDAQTQTVQRRRTTPYGEPRGAPAQDWPGQRDFAGGTRDPSTGLVHLGARQYDPTTGRFLSVDPVLNPTDPQQLNGYSYANNNPTSFDDSDGLVVVALVPVAGITLQVIAVIAIVAVVVALFEQYVVPHREEIRQSVWDFFKWAWRTVVHYATVFVTMTRIVFKIIMKRTINYVVQMVVTIKWVKKVINQVRKPVRNQAKAPKVKPDPVKKTPKKAEKPKAKKPDRKPDKSPKQADKARSPAKSDPTKPKPREGLTPRQRESMEEMLDAIKEQIDPGSSDMYDPSKWTYEHPIDRTTNEQYHDGTPKFPVSKKADFAGSEFKAPLSRRRGAIDHGLDLLETAKKWWEVIGG